MQWCATRGRPALTVKQLPSILKARWPEIEEQLLQGRYQPQPVRRVRIPKPAGGTRNLGIPTVIDRVIQQAVLQRLQPRWDPTSATPAEKALATVTSYPYASAGAVAKLAESPRMSQWEHRYLGQERFPDALSTMGDRALLLAERRRACGRPTTADRAEPAGARPSDRLPQNDRRHA